ncbi:D-amino acid dehydrogenase [Bradyrhizobium sp. NAS96.2]|uniref:D-amino acid dehydrogenase n=1 Tax=Bradyrhizobium sp. NAS96.2 TaxID=1680160 RepID=UPI00093DE70D|nr:D-amino acid dehydrogenase [Bradyrhizobium sp. NAS96.2]
MPHIIILGAGIAGVTTAYALLQSGHRVTVVDRHRYPAMETSFANGGQLSASNAEVWTSWSTIKKGITWMLKQDAPLLMNPAPSWHKYSWLAEFASNIPKYADNTITTTRLAIAARKHIFEIAENENIAFDLERRGILHIYYDKAGFDAALAVNKLLNQGGLDRQPVAPSELASIEPSLRGSFYGGFYTPSDSTGDIHKFTRGLAEACRRRGAQFVFEAEVVSIETGKGVSLTCRSSNNPSESRDVAGDAIIVCAGVGSRRLAALLGDRINVYPVKGYSITVPLEDETSQKGAPWVSMLDDRAKIVTSRLGKDRLRVAGTAEFNGMNRDIRHDRIRPLVEWVERLFPEVSTAHVVPWAGLRPMMPDMMPRVLRGKRKNVFYNTGHGHLGWTLSCITAEMVAEIVNSNA